IFFFFQAEDGIRDGHVTGVQTCALPICPGFPGNSGMKTVWSNIAPRAGVSWDPKGDGRTSLRAGYGLTGDFVTGQFFFDSRSAPPFGLEQRLTGTLLDDPWGSVGRTNPYPISVGGVDF